MNNLLYHLQLTIFIDLLHEDAAVQRGAIQWVGYTPAGSSSFRLLCYRGTADRVRVGTWLANHHHLHQDAIGKLCGVRFSLGVASQTDRVSTATLLSR